MKCVEIVPGPATADETIAATDALTRRIGKLPVVLDKEIPGFV
ncbi:MAG: 3-hydroxyacyl-CoA dehydrogenase NAD-binding domain-containing protein, partial [Aeromicrobium sp.]